MKIKERETGLILESHNELVIAQWKKQGYKDLTEQQPQKRPRKQK